MINIAINVNLIVALDRHDENTSNALECGFH